MHRDIESVVVVVGPPGAGKSTALHSLARTHPRLARFGVREYGLRLAEAGDPLGLAMRDTLLRQELLPDDMVQNEFRHFLEHLPAESGAIAVEGYPRSADQCIGLLEVLQQNHGRVTAFVEVDIPDSETRRRVVNRRLCSRCGMISTDVIGISCADCGGALMRRRDDESRRVEQRLAEYRRIIGEPRVYFAQRGLHRTIDGLKPMDVVRAELAALLRLETVGVIDEP